MPDFDDGDDSKYADLNKYIGLKIRSGRVLVGMSQKKLGEALGVSFQQIQKYEKGINEIRATTLYRIAQALDLDFQYFVEGFEKTDVALSLRDDDEISFEYDDSESSHLNNELLRYFYKIQDSSVKKRIVNLVQAIALSEQ